MPRPGPVVLWPPWSRARGAREPSAPVWGRGNASCVTSCCTREHLPALSLDSSNKTGWPRSGFLSLSERRGQRWWALPSERSCALRVPLPRSGVSEGWLALSRQRLSAASGNEVRCLASPLPGASRAVMELCLSLGLAARPSLGAPGCCARFGGLHAALPAACAAAGGLLKPQHRGGFCDREPWHTGPRAGAQRPCLKPPAHTGVGGGRRLSG